MTICFILISIGGTCQLQVSFNTGYGFYNMSDVKQFQESHRSTFPVEAEITSSFPPFWIYSFTGKTVINDDLMLGLTAAIGSTGGRTYYGDYSGSIGADQLLRFTSLGLSFGASNEYGRGLHLYFDTHPGVTFTSMKLRSFYSITGVGRDQETTAFKSINVTTQPTLGLVKRVGPVGINLYAGYHLTIVSGKLTLKENKDAYLIQDNDPVKADWSGLRFGVGVTFFLSRNVSSEAQ